MVKPFNPLMRSSLIATALAIGSGFVAAPAWSGAFSPPNRGAPDMTADGGTRRPIFFTPPNRDSPDTADSGGTRGSVRFAPPHRGAPDITADGGTRRDTAGTTYLPRTLQLLLPGSSLPMTLDAHPSFFAYIPAAPAAGLKFTLYKHNLNTGVDEQKVYEVERLMPSEAGIVEFALPTDPQYALEPGQLYHWYVSLVLDPQDPSSNWVEDGWVERQHGDSQPALQVLSNPEQQRSQVYSEAGLWHEALVAHLQQRESELAISPESCASGSNTDEWSSFLSSVNLCDLVAAPVFD